MVELDQPVYRCRMHEPRENRPQGKDKPLMRSLGEFFGHIVHGIKTDVAPPAKTVTKQTIEEESRQTPEGTVTLRRTIIEEVEVAKKPVPPGSGAAGA
jgi:hypothetical protein